MKKRYIATMMLVMGVMLLGECPDCHNIICNCRENPVYEKVEVVEPVYAAEKELTVEEMIIEKCNTYEIDSTLALAISRLETGNFTSDAYIYGNNVGGMSVDEVPVGFDTLEEGVEAFVNNLKVNYYNEGLNDVDEIAGKYCPVNEKQWAETVQALMEEIEEA